MQQPFVRNGVLTEVKQALSNNNSLPARYAIILIQKNKFILAV
jgi:hypothetical protein